ncbi:MAG: hypothetical protein ACO241_03930 [Burkholderiaceae bacterium]
MPALPLLPDLSFTDRLDAAALLLLRGRVPADALPLAQCCAARARELAALAGAPDAAQAAWQCARAGLGAAARGELPLDDAARRLAGQLLMAARAEQPATRAGVAAPEHMSAPLQRSLLRWLASAPWAASFKTPSAVSPAAASAPQAASQATSQADFLQQVDERSLQLVDQIDGWAAAGAVTHAARAVEAAHALAEGCAQAGLQPLAQWARALECGVLCAQALQTAAMPVHATDLQPLQVAASELRALLHRYAAGMVRAPAPSVQDALRRWVEEQIAALPA